MGVSRDITERKKAEAQLLQSLEEQKRAAQSLLASETRYRRLFESAKDGILILDAKTGQIEDVNPFLINLLGYTKEQFVNKFVWEIGALKDQIPNYEKFLELQKNDYIRYEDMPLQTANGKLIHVEFVSNVYTVNDSEVIQCNIRDMTDRKNMAAALLESERKYTEYINNAPDAVFVTDENGRYIDANPAATKITGYSREELLAMSIKDISAKKTMHDALKHFKKLSETGTSTGELQYLHKNGETRWWNIDAVKLSAHRFLGFSSDITDKKEAEENLIYYGYHDFLTGLTNRRYFEEALRRLDTKKGLPISVMMCDINGLKLVNDSFGHAAGDILLKAAASVLKKECRERDVVARIGGDEFAVILQKTNADAALAIAKNIKAAAQKTRVSNIALSISYGIDTKVVGNQVLAETLANAENAMQTQKLYEVSSRQNKTINLIMNTLFEKSAREAIHCNRVSNICGAIALEMGMDENAVNRLRIAGLVHDIGKIGIDENILNKPGRLDNSEFREIRRHPEAGWRILTGTNEFSELAQFVLAHQEKWDGSGYPKGLQGEEIPLEARIIGVADAYEAMTGERSYRIKMTSQEAVEELVQCSETQFDPVIVSVFINRVLPKHGDFINRAKVV